MRLSWHQRDAIGSGDREPVPAGGQRAMADGRELLCVPLARFPLGPVAPAHHGPATRKRAERDVLEAHDLQHGRGGGVPSTEPTRTVSRVRLARHVGQRGENAVGRAVPVADTDERRAHLGDHALDPSPALRSLEDVRAGVVGRDLGLIGDRVGERPLPDLIADLIRGAAGRVHPQEHRSRPLLVGAQAAVRSPGPANARLRCRAIWMPRLSLISSFTSASRTASPTRSRTARLGCLAGSGPGDDQHGRGDRDAVVAHEPLYHVEFGLTERDRRSDRRWRGGPAKSACVWASRWRSRRER